MNTWSLLHYQTHPLRISGPIIEAVMPDVEIGEICDIRRHWRETEVVARAQVLGFHNEHTILSLIGTAKGLSRQSAICPTGRALNIKLGDYLRGCVLDPSGNVVECLTTQLIESVDEVRAIEASAPSYQERIGVREPLVTGVRVIDGLLSCGIGQRLGIFASAGCGKTTLMHMLIDHADADIFIIGLIGERGREVTEFIDTIRASGRENQCVVIFATSDFSSLDRCNAALVATTVAEYFRDCGKRVVLFLDSITRYARALRDVALASGEAPARRGYPASVFDALPKILERPGNTKKGSITAFYTILLEGEDESDPIAEEIRSILDGHIYLSRKLAAKNHYPAIDVLNSVSRVMGQILSKNHLEKSSDIRHNLAKFNELQIFLDLGEYKKGDNIENDRLIEKCNSLNKWLCQEISEHNDISTTLRQMDEFR